jgi:uncharacterized membrane protein YphA (DoxX/SURF4 family)
MLMAAGVIEMIGGFLIAIGFYSRWVAFICSGEMAFAYWGCTSCAADRSRRTTRATQRSCSASFFSISPEPVPALMR